MARNALQLAGLGLTGVLLAACSSGSAGTHASGSTAAATPTSGGAQSVTFGTTNMFRFTPATVRVHVGAVHIVLTDTGAYPHNISFPELHQTSSSVSGNPGQQSTALTVDF